jgi:hypothetical protein
MEINKITQKIKGSPIEVHKSLGPCLLKSAYEGCLALELKLVDEFNPVHLAQILTYKKFSKKIFGLLINFNVTTLKNGIRRFSLYTLYPSVYSQWNSV